MDREKYDGVTVKGDVESESLNSRAWRTVPEDKRRITITKQNKSSY